MSNRPRRCAAALMQVLPVLPMLLGGFAATAPLQARAEAPVGEKRYLCCNMRALGDWFNDINYDDKGTTVLPYGTPVKIIEVSPSRLRIEINGKPYRFNNDYSRKLGMSEFVKRYLLVDDPRPAQKDLPDAVRQAIDAFTVVPGMTREQVLLAMSYPIADETPEVQVDGKVVGRLRTSDTLCLQLDPGAHKVEIGNDTAFQPAEVAAAMDIEVLAQAQPQFLRLQRTFVTRGQVANELTTTTERQGRKRQ